MTARLAAWAIVLCPLALIGAAALIFGAGTVSAAFEAFFYAVAWIIAVWAVLLGVA